MELVPSFRELVQQAAFVFTSPAFAGVLIVLTGGVFARRRTVTRVILAADAVDTKPHSAFHRVFAAERRRFSAALAAHQALFHARLSGAPPSKTEAECDGGFRCAQPTLPLDLKARLYDAPPRRRPGTNGRPRKRGGRLPTPLQMLDQRRRRLALNLYGRRDRSRVADTAARVYAAPQRPLRVVAVQPLSGGRRTQAFYSTCATATAGQVLTWCAPRWSLEETFHECKGQLGFEEPQGWTRRAVERTAPTAMLLYSLIVLWFAADGYRHCRTLRRPWYRTRSGACFSEMRNTLRVQSVRHQVSLLRRAGRGRKKRIKTLFHALQRAA